MEEDEPIWWFFFQMGWFNHLAVALNLGQVVVTPKNQRALEIDFQTVGS